MANVLDITPHLPEPPFLDIEVPLQILTRLAQIGAISRHAHGIGALALARMQQNGKYCCELSRQDFTRGAVLVDGEPTVALGDPSIDALANSLQSLQCYIGLWNHVNAARVGKGKEKYNHFTENHRGEGDFAPLRRVIQHSTPIHFVWLPEKEEEFIAGAKDIISHKLMIAKWANIRTVKFPK